MIPFSVENFETLMDWGGFDKSICGEEDWNKLREAYNEMNTCKTYPKGILVAGDFGCGKTYFAEAIRRGAEDVRFYNMSATVGDMSNYTENEYYLRDGNDVIIDDLGAENNENKFGQVIIHQADFICWLHKFNYNKVGQWKLGRRKLPRLFITTNLDGKGIDERYGSRVFSRLNEMCVKVKMNGKDKRK